MLKRVVHDARTLVARIARQWKFPPEQPILVPQLAVAGMQHPTSSSYMSVEDITRAFQTLLGVPKFRTSKPKKQTRKFSQNKLLTPVENLTACQECGKPHEINTICGDCYDYIFKATEKIKRRMMKYNPYVGESQVKKVHVRYNDDPEVDEHTKRTKMVVEVDEPRLIDPSATKPLPKDDL